MDVFVGNEQRLEVDADDLLSLAYDVLQGERQRPETEVNVLLVDEQSMTSLHERFMGEPGPTDVLAFPLDEEDDIGPSWPPGRQTESEEEPFLLGDVVICPSVAAQQASAAGWALRDELRLLLVHGLLHLTGFDHFGSDEAARMEERQAYYLKRFDA